LSSVFGPEDVERLLAYTPVSISPQAWEQVREAVLEVLVRTAPASSESARKALQPLIHFTTWAFANGYGGAVEGFYTAELVETWREVAARQAARGAGSLTTASVVDYVSRLRQMGPKATPGAGWPPVAGDLPAGAKRHLREPYSDTDVAAWVNGLLTAPNTQRRKNAEAFVALGFGAGLFPRELPLITPEMVVTDSSGVWVEIPGAHARRVPLAAPWAQLAIRCAARTAPSEPLAVVPAGKNGLANAMSALRLSVNGARLAPQRMRTTWLVHRLRAGVDARLLMDWAGLTSLNAMVDLLTFLPPADPGEALQGMRAAVGAEVSW
jgi:integrase